MSNPVLEEKLTLPLSYEWGFTSPYYGVAYSESREKRKVRTADRTPPRTCGALVALWFTKSPIRPQRGGCLWKGALVFFIRMDNKFCRGFACSFCGCHALDQWSNKNNDDNCRRHIGEGRGVRVFVFRFSYYLRTRSHSAHNYSTVSSDYLTVSIH